VVYRNVQVESAAMSDMLALTRGRRDVPVVVEGGKVTIGYGGS
jgi:glutaredoxin 3